jgi:hypothetical protein
MSNCVDQNFHSYVLVAYCTVHGILIFVHDDDQQDHSITVANSIGRQTASTGPVSYHLGVVGPSFEGHYGT